MPVSEDNVRNDHRHVFVGALCPGRHNAERQAKTDTFIRQEALVRDPEFLSCTVRRHLNATERDADIEASRTSEANVTLTHSMV